MNCFSCNNEIDPGQLPGLAEGRRWSKLVQCSCNAFNKVMTVEGWDKWYLVAGKFPDPNDPEGLLEETIKGCDSDSFYERFGK